MIIKKVDKDKLIKLLEKVESKYVSIEYDEGKNKVYVKTYLEDDSNSLDYDINKLIV